MYGVLVQKPIPAIVMRAALRHASSINALVLAQRFYKLQNAGADMFGHPDQETKAALDAG